MDDEGLAGYLESTGSYRVLRKLMPRQVVERPRPEFSRRGVILDTETTGLNHRTDEIIEIGVIAFTFDDQGAIGDVTGIYGGLRQPNVAIPAEITRLTQNANGLIDDEGRQLLSSAGESMAALERATSRLDELLSSNQGALNNGLQGFSELGPAINELRGTLGALRRVTQRLEDNPSGFLLGREKIQEFNP